MVLKQREYKCTDSIDEMLSYYSYQQHSTQEEYDSSVTIGRNFHDDEDDAGENVNEMMIIDQLFVTNILQQRWYDVNSILSTEKLVTQLDSQSFATLHPIHAACSMSSVPVEVIEKLLGVCCHDKDEECAVCFIQDEDGNLPVHIACSTPGINPLVIQTLLEAAPETSFQREFGDGELPLYLLLEQDNGLEIFLMMVETLPKRCFIDPYRKTSFLHEPCKNLYTTRILEKVLDLYPEIALLQNRNGDTIAHVICSHRDATPSMVKTLHDRFPFLFFMKDYDGNLPLHIVNSEKYSEEIIEILLNAYPKSVNVRNKQMHSPLSSPHIRSSPDKVRAVIENSRTKDVRNLLHTFKESEPLVNAQVFSNLQNHLSAICYNSQMEATSSLLQKLYHSNALLKDEVNALSSLMSCTYQNSFDWSSHKWNNTSSDCWITFPLFTKLLLCEDPNAAFYEDSQGDLLLHKFSRAKSKSTTLSMCSVCDCSISGGIFFWLDGDRKCCTECQNSLKRQHPSKKSPLPVIDYQPEQLLKDVLRLNPRAAKVENSYGYLPLHLSLESGKSWFIDGVEDVFNAAPEASFTRCRDGRTAITIAAENCDLTTIFELLRRSPHLLGKNFV